MATGKCPTTPRCRVYVCGIVSEISDEGPGRLEAIKSDKSTSSTGVFRKSIIAATMFKTSHGTNLAYDYTAPSAPSTTLLFIHGFPSHRKDWEQTTKFCFGKGYGTLSIDLPGFGDSKVADHQAPFRQKIISDEIVELLDHEGIAQPVIGIGHDIGAMMLSRLAMYYPDRIAANIYLSVGPNKPAQHFDLDAINKATKEMMGYEYLGYINFISRNPHAELTLETCAKGVTKLMFSEDETIWQRSFRPIGAMKSFITANPPLIKVAAWYPEARQLEHLRVYSTTGGYEGAVRWYQMMDNNTCVPDEEAFAEWTNTKPALLIVPEKDADQQKQMAEVWHENLTLQSLQSGHWVHLECADEVNARVEEFVVQYGGR